MPGIRGLAATIANATGLTGLDATSSAYSLGLWVFKQFAPTLWFSPFRHVNSSGTPNRDGVMLEVSPDSVNFYSANATTIGTASADGILAPVNRLSGRWFHLGVSWDGARVVFYYNGVAVSSVALTTPTTVNGTRWTAIGHTGFLGKMFDLRVFPNLALGAGEMRALMDPRRAIGGCAGRWFRNWRAGASSICYDESGSGLNTNLTMSSSGANGQECEEPPWREAVGIRRLPIRLKGLAAAGGLSIPVAMHSYRERRALV